MVVTPRGLAWLLLLLLYGTHFRGLVRCDPEQDPDQYYDYEDYPENEESTNCHPEEADRCFSPLTENLMCHMVTPVGRNCSLRDAADFCGSLKEALECIEDIVDTSCSVLEGRLTFDVWLKGLRAVHRHMCLQNDHLEIVNELLQGSKCWRLKKFVNCVEERANITHVSDLLTTQLDLLACNRLQMAIATCNADAEKNRARCRGKSQAVFEALISFFSATSCGLTDIACATWSVPGTSTSPATSSPSPPISSGLYGGGVSSRSSALAVVVTIMVMVVMAGVVGLVLGRQGVLTVHLAKLKLRTTAGDDTQAVYDNF